MSKIGIFMADGCEEIEGLTVVDVVRRAKMEIVMLSITGKKEVTSSHGVTFLADALAEETGYEDLDGIVLPGGMPGTMHLLENETVNAMIDELATEFDTGKRAELAIQLQQAILDDNAYVFCSFLQMNMISKSTVTGYTAHACDYYQVTADLDIRR